MRLCNAGQAQLLLAKPYKQNKSDENQLNEGNNNQLQNSTNNNQLKGANITEQGNITIERLGDINSNKNDEIPLEDDNGNNYDCYDNPKPFFDKSICIDLLLESKTFEESYTNLRDSPDVPEEKSSPDTLLSSCRYQQRILGRSHSNLELFSADFFERPYPASFTVQTTTFPVSGTCEPTVLLSEDDSAEDSSEEDHMTAATDVQASSKLAKDTANERKLAEVEEKTTDPWVPLGKSPRIKHRTADNAALESMKFEASLDLGANESRLRHNKRDDSRRKNDREEIRRRLAMGVDADDAVGRKPSLQSRLQGGMNLQICFMNDLGNDSDTESSSPPSPPTVVNSHTRPNSLPIKNALVEPPALGPPGCLGSDTSLAACQARLQAEARHALMQAHEMARMQMQVERQSLPISPITQMIRNSLTKVGVSYTEDRRRLSRQLVTDMNVAQLQIIINDLHSQIELLNDELVQLLVSRDDLHMEQDSMLVDIEDLTRFIDAKCVQEADSALDVPA